MKKGLVLFLIVMPLALSFECVTYEDCFKRQCIGSARICAEGTCIYSECVEDAGVKDFIGITGRIVLLTMVTIIVSLMFPLIKLQGRARVIALMLAAGFLAGLSLYLFSGTGITLSGSWDSENADKAVRNVIESDNLDLEEEVFRMNDGYAKEYTLSNPLREYSIVAYEGATEEIRISNGFYQKIITNVDSVVFIVAGEKSEEIVKLLKENKTKIVKQTVNRNPPKIELIKPSGRYTSNQEVKFIITDNETYVNSSSIKVSIPGFDRLDCYIANKIAYCTFDAELKQGQNKFEIRARDTDNMESVIVVSVVYDTQPWKMHTLYPEQGSYVNSPKLHFTATDQESGMSDVNISTVKSDCNSINTGLDCDFDNVEYVQGPNTVVVKGYDRAGNYNEKEINFIFDNQRPSIQRTTKGFILSDNTAIELSSLMVDQKRYDFDKCHRIDNEHHCAYEGFISTISIRDMAGNLQTTSYKLER